MGSQLVGYEVGLAVWGDVMVGGVTQPPFYST